MTTSKKQTPPARPSKQLVHETNAITRQHRLVIVTGGRPDSSPWYELNAVGIYKGMYFSSGRIEIFPAGPFSVRALPYEVLA